MEQKNHIPNWNVISEKEFKERVRIVFEQVSNALSNTLGPYGSTTIIEKYGEMHITKDGWSVLKEIKFDDITDTNILALLVRIAAQVVIKVGDGSTSSIVTANNVLKGLEKTDMLKNIPPRDFVSALKVVVDEISDRIRKSAKKINSTDEIYNLALIATNGDETIAEMIKTIYDKTGNPSIDFTPSKTSSHVCEIIEGYKADIKYLDRIFANNEYGECVIDNPVILLFDHVVDTSDVYLKIIEKGKQLAYDRNTKLVVVASGYDQYFHEKLKREINLEYRTTGTSTAVYCTTPLINNHLKTLYSDFRLLVGANMVDQQFILELKEELYNKENHNIEGKLSMGEIDDFFGTVKSITITGSSTVIRGFEAMNTTMYDKTLQDAKLQYAELEKQSRDLGIIDSSLNLAKQRITKLIGHMGVIHVGGNSTLEVRSTKDLVEDAVKACESAFEHGYNIGGNLCIPFIIKQMLVVEDCYKDEKEKRTLLNILYHAFIDTFKTILIKGENKENIDTIIDECLGGPKLKCYDLVKREYSDEIINSCMTDIEILKATTSIVSLLISSNQYLTVVTTKG